MRMDAGQRDDLYQAMTRRHLGWEVIKKRNLSRIIWICHHLWTLILFFKKSLPLISPFYAHGSVSPKSTRLLYFLVTLAMLKHPSFCPKFLDLHIYTTLQDIEGHTLSDLFGHQGTSSANDSHGRVIPHKSLFWHIPQGWGCWREMCCSLK